MIEEDEGSNHAAPHEGEHATDFEAAKVLSPGGNYQIKHPTLRSEAPNARNQDGWPSGGLKCGPKR
jgi:hypothetical protein